MTKTTVIKIAYLILSFPLTILILEMGIRIAAPQAVEEIAYEDIYTTRFSSSLNDDVKSLKPGLTRMMNGAEVKVNNQGNRDFEYEQDKKEGIKRIAIVGSSVAFGFRLGLDDTFGKLLERKLNENSTETEYEVLLFGRPGFKAIETFACIKDKVLSYSPDLIIYSFVQNNYETQSVEEFFSKVKNIANGNQNKSLKNSDSVLRKLRKYWRRMRNSDSGRFIRSHFHLYLFSANSIANILRELSPTEKESAQGVDPLFPDTPEFKKKLACTESWISLMNQECIKKNIQFSVLIHPYEMQLTKYGAEKWKLKGILVPEDVLDFRTHQIMGALSKRYGFNLIDIVPALRNYKGRSDDLYIEGDYGHYSVIGNKVIADYLVEEVLKLATYHTSIPHAYPEAE